MESAHAWSRSRVDQVNDTTRSALWKLRLATVKQSGNTKHFIVLI